MTTTLERPRTLKRPSVPISGRSLIYSRVSSRQQEDGASLDVQLEGCQRYCESQGDLVIAELCDVQSGLDSTRPAYQKAIALARNGGVDKLVVWRLDRLGRDSAEYIPLLKELKRLGVDVVSVTQPTESMFMQQVIGVMAEEESRQLSTRITASKRHLASNGKWASSAPFGYDIQRSQDGGCVLIPNDQAPLVTECFRRYSAGRHSLNDLRNYLNEHGWPKSRTAINYLLKNVSYLGLIRRGVFSRSQFAPQEITQHQGDHQPLIDQETFDKVQQRLSGNKHRHRGGTAPKYLFSGLIHCGGCGHKFAGRATQGRQGSTRIEYTCTRKHNFDDCPSHSVMASRIRAAVIPHIERLLGELSQADIRTAVRAEMLRQASETQASGQQSRDSLTETQKRFENRLSRLEDSYLDGDIRKDRYIAKRDEILGQLEEIKAHLSDIPKAAAPDIDNLIAIAETIAVGDLDDQAWREIVENMVDRIVIEGTGGDGRKAPATVRVEWKAEYAGLIGDANE